MMPASFNINPSTTIIPCYNPINSIIPFYNELSSFVRCIHKHNVLIIGGNVNAILGKDQNNKFY